MLTPPTDLMYLSTPSLGITHFEATPRADEDRASFNSLSRDHMRAAPAYSLPTAVRLSTPSLGITWRCLADRPPRGCWDLSTPSLGITRKQSRASLAKVRTITFNSLSRDHAPYGTELTYYTWEMLSTPSLGITASSSRRGARRR